MFENEKDLFGDLGELDLGSDLEKDFADFTPVDDGEDTSSIFGDEKKEAETQPEPVAEAAPTVIEKAEQETEGMCTSVTEAIVSDNVISFIPSSDGRVYELRKNKIGAFIAPADYVSVLGKVRAGFIPALPKIPNRLLEQAISFFRSFMSDDGVYEAIVYIYWSVEDSKYYIFVPKQQVSGTTIDTTVPEVGEEKYILAMEIHSHNHMAAEFSVTDNKDEKVTRLYTVVGRLDKLSPDINTRISVGGKYVKINPANVFEGINAEFPETWRNAVEISQPLKGDVIK